MSVNKFPPDWDEERVERVLAHYEEQSEEEAISEDEAAFDDQTHTMIAIPTAWSLLCASLLPDIKYRPAIDNVNRECVRIRRN